MFDVRDTMDNPGCRVTAVGPGTGAEAAALRAGEVIGAIDGEPVADLDDIVPIVRGN